MWELSIKRKKNGRKKKKNSVISYIVYVDKIITQDEYWELLVIARRKGIPEEHARAMIKSVAIQVNAEVYDEKGNKLRGRER